MAGPPPAQMLAGVPADRGAHVVAGAAYAGKELKGLPPGITWTARLRKDAAPYELPRPVPGGGDGPAQMAISCRPRPGSPLMPRSPGRIRYGKAATIGAAAITCLWYGPFSIQPDRAENTLAAGCPPAVSLPDGHGMILIERCVDLRDTTYRVIFGRPGPWKSSRP
jgi:hypothetical protein